MRFFLLFFTLIGIFPLYAWELIPLNVKEEGVNTKIFLQHKEASEAKIVLSFYQANSRNWVQKHVFYYKNQAQSLSFNLPTGNYTVTAEIYAPQGFELIEIPYSIKTIPNIFLSDIHFSENPIFSLLSQKASRSSADRGELKTLYWGADLYENQHKTLNVQLTFYTSSREQGRGEAQQYEAIYTRSEVLNLSQNRALIRENIDISAWKEGDYLVEITVYAEGKLLTEKNATFHIKSDWMEAILCYWQENIEPLSLIFPAKQMEDLLQITDNTSRKKELLALWEQRFPGQAEASAKAFFATLSEVNKRFSGIQSGWKTERGRTWIYYGKPDSIRSVKQNSLNQERWYYNAQNLVLLFLEEEDEWKMYCL